MKAAQAFIALLDSAAPEHRVAIVAATNSRSSILAAAMCPHRLGLEVYACLLSQLNRSPPTFKPFYLQHIIDC